MNASIPPSEVIAAIKIISNEKAPGPDGIKAEFYKIFIHELIGLLFDVYTKFIDSGTIPNSITNATIILLYKKEIEMISAIGDQFHSST